MKEPLVFPIRGRILAMQAAVEKTVCHRRSKYQSIDVIDTTAFGRTLLLDGHIQLTELDEHAYHEALVHIPLLSIPEPKTALVVGGGDGGVIRELVKHTSLTKIEMVEIDEQVTAASRECMPSVSNGAFDDPRVVVHFADAFPFVKKADGPYDIIVVDCTDVYEGEDGALSEMLFTDGFYQDLKRILSPKGIVVTQADNPVFCPYSLQSVRTMFERVFDKAGDYHAIVPSFGGFSAFCWGSRGAQPSTTMPAIPSGFLLKALNQASWACSFTDIGF